MKAVVFSLGCKVNECESASILSDLKSRGYEVSDRLEPADLYIVNTCAVTKEAEKKSRQCAARIRAVSKTGKIIFIGCASEKNPQDFIGKQNVIFVSGTFGKNRIAEFIDNGGAKLQVFDHTPEYEEMSLPFRPKTRTFIKVQDGCDNFCSYCIIPYLRGRSRSRNPESVLEEIKRLDPIEAVINGINLSAYNYNGETLPRLIGKLKDVNARIRLGSLEVNVITEEFLSALKNLKNFAEHFHLSLQSGANAVLKAMNRHYTREEFIKKVELIRKYFPCAGITTDIIAGFPTETEKDFADTIKLVEEVEFSDIHPFVFSPREGTVAYKMKDLPSEIKKERLNVLLDCKSACKSTFAKKNVGCVAEVLFEETEEGYAVGYSGNYLRVYVKDHIPTRKKLEKVKIKAEFKEGVIAESGE